MALCCAVANAAANEAVAEAGAGASMNFNNCSSIPAAQGWVTSRRQEAATAVKSGISCSLAGDRVDGSDEAQGYQENSRRE